MAKCTDLFSPHLKSLLFICFLLTNSKIQSCQKKSKKKRNINEIFWQINMWNIKTETKVGHKIRKLQKKLLHLKNETTNIINKYIWKNLKKKNFHYTIFLKEFILLLLRIPTRPGSCSNGVWYRCWPNVRSPKVLPTIPICYSCPKCRTRLRDIEGWK